MCMYTRESKSMGRKRKHLRVGEPHHRSKTHRCLELDGTPGDRETLDRWLTATRGAILDKIRYLDDDWPAHGA